MATKENEKPKMRLFPIITFLIMIWLLAIIAASFFTSTDDKNPYANVAIIKVYGIITTTGEDGYFESVASSNEIIQLLEEAEQDPSIKAIVLDINSPGGSPVASEEIGNKLKSINKTTVAWIRDLGASGAYWIASSTDYVVASRLSLVGSIGVTGSYVEFAGLLERYNMTYRSLVSGKYKDAGSPFKELTPEDEAKIMELIDELHLYFVEEVAENRNLSLEETEELATGEVFTGAKGKQLGLVDEVGGMAEVTSYLRDDLNTTVEYALFEQEETLLDLLRVVSADHGFAIGEGIGSFLNKNQPLITT